MSKLFIRRKTRNQKFSGGVGVQNGGGVLMLNPMEAYSTCAFPGVGVYRPPAPPPNPESANEPSNSRSLIRVSLVMLLL